MERNEMLQLMQEVAIEHNKEFDNACRRIGTGRKHRFKLTDCISRIKVGKTVLDFN